MATEKTILNQILDHCYMSGRLSILGVEIDSDAFSDDHYTVYGQIPSDIPLFKGSSKEVEYYLLGIQEIRNKIAKLDEEANALIELLEDKYSRVTELDHVRDLFDTLDELQSRITGFQESENWI